MWRPGRPDFQRLFDATYDLDSPVERWLQAIVEALRPALPGASLPSLAIGNADGRRMDVQQAWSEEPGLASRFIEFSKRQPPDYIALRFARPVSTDIQLLGDAARATAHLRWATERGAKDCFGCTAASPNGQFISLAALLPARAGRWPAAVDAWWNDVASHVVSGYRLRSAREEDNAPVDAIFTSDGRLVDASDEAVSRHAVLRQAVRDLRRSRGRWRDRPDPEQARRPDVGGRWTLVDQFESDGRHFIVAYAFDEPRRAPLSRQEERVADRLCAGWSLARIADAMGLTAGTVSGYARRVYAKLGVQNRFELARVGVRPRRGSRER